MTTITSATTTVPAFTAGSGWYWGETNIGQQQLYISPAYTYNANIEPEGAAAGVIRHRRAEVAKMRRRVAERRALRLLVDHLDEAQRAEFALDSTFTVEGNGVLYRITNGRTGNLLVIEGGRIAERWCVHPELHVPNYDTMLAQKLMIEAGFADELREIANIDYLRGPLTVEI